MPPVPVAEFESALRSLSAAERTAFVADLWATRGWETTVEDDVVVAERDDERRQIQVVDPGRFGTPDVSDVDALVAARDRDAVRAAAIEAGVEYVPPTDLRNLLLYGIDRETARDLYEKRFDQPLERAPPSEDEESETESGQAGVLSAVLPSLADTGPSLSGNRRAVVALVLLAVVGVVVAGPMLSGGAPNQSPITVNDVTPDDESGGAIGAASPSPTSAPSLAPGVTRAGVVDPMVLAAAHVEGVSNRSRVQTRSFRGPPNETSTSGVIAQNGTALIENVSYYRYENVATIPGENGTTQTTIGLYGDGNVVYQRIGLSEDVRYSRHSVMERPATNLDDDVQVYLYRYFAGANADETVVTCAIEFETDCPTYRIEVTGEPPATLGEDIADYEALAIVSENGVVTTIRASYTLPDSDDDGEREPVSFSLDYRFEEVDVTAPEWLPAAQNQTTTNGTATATATPTPTTEPT